MSSNYIKLHYKILDEQKSGLLPDNLWRRLVELSLFAGELNKDGQLPQASIIAWRLRLPQIELDAELCDLRERGFIQQNDTGWFLVDFSRSQGPVFPTLYPNDWTTIREIILNRDNQTCVYCGNPATHVDHIVPVSKGGLHVENNLVSACERCNKSKNNRDFLTWYLNQDFFSRTNLDYINSIFNGVL